MGFSLSIHRKRTYKSLHKDQFLDLNSSVILENKVTIYAILDQTQKWMPLLPTQDFDKTLNILFLLKSTLLVFSFAISLQQANGKKDIKFRDSSALNFILFFK